MDVNQFALYQLKNIPENRQIRFRPYNTLQEKGIQVRYGNYEQVYLARMQPEDGRKKSADVLTGNRHAHFMAIQSVSAMCLC